MEKPKRNIGRPILKGAAPQTASPVEQAGKEEQKPVHVQEPEPVEARPQPETNPQQNVSKRPVDGQRENQRESPRLHIGITPGEGSSLHYGSLVRLFSDGGIFENMLPFVYGSPALLSQAAEKSEWNELNVQVHSNIQEIKGKRVQMLNPQAGEEETEDNGYLALQMGIRHLAEGHLRALVSLPFDEEKLRQRHSDFKTQAIAVAEIFSGSPFRMLLARSMKLSFLTTAGRHDMAEYLTAQRVEQRLKALYSVLQSDFSVTTPRIVVLGSEMRNAPAQSTEIDRKVLTPLINNLFENGMPVFGPYPAQGFFSKSGAQAFDAVLCMYKEQMEMVFERYPKEDCCYYTAGLPIVHVETVFGGNSVENAFRSVHRALCMAADIDAARQQNRKLTENPLGYHAVSYKRDGHEDN